MITTSTFKPGFKNNIPLPATPSHALNAALPRSVGDDEAWPEGRPEVDQ